MRKCFIVNPGMDYAEFCQFVSDESPWAAYWVDATNGCWAFECLADYEIMKAQV